MSCPVKNGKFCHTSKTLCERDSYKDCNYFLRQCPADRSLYESKFARTLLSACQLRLILKGTPDFSKFEIDFSDTIYNNVNRCLESIPPQIIKIEVPVKEEIDLLHEDVLSKLTQKKYIEQEIELVKRDYRINSIIIRKHGYKVSCRLSETVDTFMDNLKKAKNKGKYFLSKIEEEIILP